MNTIVEVAASLAEVSMVVALCNRFLHFKNERMHLLKSLVFFLVLSAEDILGSHWEGMEYVSDFLFIVLIGVYVFLFLDGRIFEKMLLTFFPALTILPINLTIMNMFRVLSGEFLTDIIRPGGQVRIPVLLLSKLAFFLVCEFMVYVRRKRWGELDGFRWGIQFSCFLITFLIAWLLFTISIENEKMPEVLLVSILIVVLNILLFVLLGKMQRDAAWREKHRLSEISLAEQEKRIAETREQYTEMRTLRHDMRHHLTAAADLLKEGKVETAIAYIENVRSEQVEQAVVGVDTGNVVADAVINHRIAVCQRERIEMKCMIDSSGWAVTDTDMSVLLSNLLDNAIYGCRGAENPQIELTIGTRKALTYIIVKNSIAASVLKRNPKLRTDKEDQAAHGLGVLSIRRVAEKYGGSVEFGEAQNAFIAEVWMENVRSVPS